MVPAKIAPISESIIKVSNDNSMREMSNRVVQKSKFIISGDFSGSVRNLIKVDPDSLLPVKKYFVVSLDLLMNHIVKKLASVEAFIVFFKNPVNVTPTSVPKSFSINIKPGRRNKSYFIV